MFRRMFHPMFRRIFHKMFQPMFHWMFHRMFNWMFLRMFHRMFLYQLIFTTNMITSTVDLIFLRCALTNGTFYHENIWRTKSSWSGILIGWHLGFTFQLCNTKTSYGEVHRAHAHTHRQWSRVRSTAMSPSLVNVTLYIALTINNTE